MSIAVSETKMNKTDEKATAESLMVQHGRTPMERATANGIVTLICLTVGEWYSMVLGAVGTNARIAAQNIPVTISYGSHATIDYARAVCNAVISGFHRTETTRSDWEWAGPKIDALYSMLANPMEFSAFLVEKCCIRLPIDPTTGTGVELARFNPITKFVSLANACGQHTDRVALDSINLVDWVKSAYKKDAEGVTVHGFLTEGHPPARLVGQAEELDQEAEAEQFLSILADIGVEVE